MARYFSQPDIDEFKECFSLFARRGFITRLDELTVIMRSLGYSPTQYELKEYYKDHIGDGKIDFATFLEIMYKHSQAERCRDDILGAFKAMDKDKTGYVSASDLRKVLLNYGEKITPQENRVYREARIQRNGTVKYEELIRFLMRPL